MHNNPCGWAVKEGNALGRFTVDPGHARSGCVLNSAASKQSAIDRYGPAPTPSIREIVSRWVRFTELHRCSWADCSIYKDDYTNAHGQIDYAPEDARLMTIPVSESLALVHVTGNFGHNGSCFTYDLPARATVRAVSKRIHGLLDKFCDDHIGFSLDATASQDKAIGQEWMRKDEAPAKVHNVLGYEVNLLDGTIGLPPRACRKICLAFLYMDKLAPHPRNSWQGLAGTAEHYSWVLSSEVCAPS